MSEYRKDLITGRWRIIAEGRSARPNEYAAPATAVSEEANCPFCEGQEGRTPPESSALRPPESIRDGPGWSARVIPNMFPTVNPTALPPPGAAASPFERAAGVGVHEVIVETPRHFSALASLPEDHLRALFHLFRERVRVATSRPKITVVVLFENRGPDSGGTLRHPHAQLVATETMASRLDEELAGFRRQARSAPGSCLAEAVVAAERRAGDRVISEGGGYTCFAPFASEVPYELWIVPDRHVPSFADASDEEVDRLAGLLPQALRALDDLRPNLSYNWSIHGLAAAEVEGSDFHWHVEVTPRLVRPDGFELSTGTPVNSVAPETAASELRSHWGAPRVRKP